jgi:fumarate reductase subunit D
MIPASRKQPGFAAALLHRLSGILLAVFLPFHFLVLALALESADALDSFLRITAEPLVKLSEAALVAALGLHMALGIRVLAIEFLGLREHTLSAVCLCAAAAVAAGAALFLSSML